MFTQKNLMTVCCVAVLAFGLTACLSSSDDDNVMDTGMDNKTPKPMEPEMMPRTKKEIDADTKAAGTKEKAIGVEADQTAADDDGPGGIGVPDGEDHKIDISRDRDRTTVTITVFEAAADAPKFIMQDVDLEQFEKNDFISTMHVLKMDADGDGNVVEEVVIVSTDIDAPTDIPFVKDVTDTDSKGRYELNANPKTTGDTTANQSLTFDTTPHSGRVMLTDSRVVVPGPDGSVTLESDDDETADVMENEYRGTFDGAMGTFTCTLDAGCDVTVVNGEITNMASVYFTPDDEHVTVKEDDADYLHYGVWLKKTTDEDGVLTYNEVETFAGSSVDKTGSVAEVQGTAEYNGGATGVYVKNEYKPDRTIASATSGFFTANVNLMAYFGQRLVEMDIPPGKLNTVTGTIDQFVLEHGGDPMWSVALDGIISPGDATASGTADGGGDDPGSFNATFHGPTPPIEANSNVLVAPGALVGEFNANFTDGTVAGGFGARK